MTTEQNLILNLPLDETAGGTVAYDYAPNRHDAAISGGARFVAGRRGNCLRFDATGKAEIEADILNLSGNFTLLAWIKGGRSAESYNRKRIGLICNTDAADGAREAWIETEPDTWNFFAVRKAGNNVSLLFNMQTVATLSLPGTLTGTALLQDIYSTPYAAADLDEVKLYNAALADWEIEQELTSISQLEYCLDGTNLRDFGIRVESSTGILDLPKLKTPAATDWPDCHGRAVDLKGKRFDEREITLNCWLKASGKMDFTERLNAFYDKLRHDGTQRLMIAIHPTRPLLYEVYCEDGIAPTKRWHDGRMTGSFALKLKEPDPVKRIVRHQRISGNTATLSLAFRTGKAVNVYWGDGSADYDLYGDMTGSNAITHTYAENGVYYAIVGGVIEEIEDFSTNGIITWNRL